MAPANEPRSSGPMSLLSREEVVALTGTTQPKRMCEWLSERAWVFEMPARRGDFPKVLWAYKVAREAGTLPVPVSEDPPPHLRLVAKPGRRYEGSALQRYNEEQREISAERRASDARIETERAKFLHDNRFKIAEDKRQSHAALIRYHAAKRRVTKLQRTAPWADEQAIRAIYAEARRLTRVTGIEHHVDHTIPLQGKLVSGLHVEANLQILTGSENSRKRNTFTPC